MLLTYKLTIIRVGQQVLVIYSMFESMWCD